MPNIKSAKKRVLVTEKKSKENASAKTGYKTDVKKLDVAIANKENVKETFNKAVKSVDKACAKGILKKNTANRKKSALAKKVNAAK